MIKLFYQKICGIDVYNSAFAKKMVRMISNELAKVSSLYKVQGVPGMVRFEIVQNK